MIKENIKIKNHIGTWYVIEETIDETYGIIYLLEHEQYGDETACLIIDENLKVLKQDVWNGFSDLDF